MLYSGFYSELTLKGFNLNVLMTVVPVVMLLSFFYLLSRTEYSDSLALSSDAISVGLSASNGSLKFKIFFDDLEMNGLYSSINHVAETSDAFAFRAGVETDFISDMYYFEIGAIHFGVSALIILALRWFNRTGSGNIS